MITFLIMAIGKDELKNKHYPIKGIPPNTHTERKTENIPFVKGLPLRRELTSFYEDANKGDEQLQKQWTLFVFALETFKALPVQDKHSYFQIAGIHGLPETTWDDVPIPKATEDGPYRPSGQPQIDPASNELILNLTLRDNNLAADSPAANNSSAANSKPTTNNTLSKPPGYCHHNTISFPIWHRPYLLLFEVWPCLWSNFLAR